MLHTRAAHLPAEQAMCSLGVMAGCLHVGLLSAWRPPGDSTMTAQSGQRCVASGWITLDSSKAGPCRWMQFWTGWTISRPDN